ncbi:MAG: hypothetical protein IIX18_03790 [Clostridia bacterium]|nr:hypothetical protein [Clostridia bacterium]
MHVLIEPSFMSTHWCSHYLKGISAQAKKKGISVEVHTEAAFIHEPSFDDTHVILLGSSLAWASHYMSLLYASDIYPIVLSIANYQKEFPYASFITMDYEDASRKLMKYLHTRGAQHTALFSCNRKSSTDRQKVSNFLACGGKEEDIYYYDGSMKDICDKLISKIDTYDSVLCANDVSAVVLMRKLLDIDVKIPDNVQLASFGDTMLSNLEVHNIAVAHVKSFEAGQMAINAYRMLKSNPSISSLSFLLHCEIVDSDFNLVEIRLSHDLPPADPATNAPFFKDPEVEKVLLVEKLLAGCDKLDVRILREVINKESYSKIAAKLFIAENTISYRIKKILSMAPEKSKDEVLSLLAQYLFW